MPLHPSPDPNLARPTCRLGILAGLHRLEAGGLWDLVGTPDAVRLLQGLPRGRASVHIHRRLCGMRVGGGDTGCVGTIFPSILRFAQSSGARCASGQAATTPHPFATTHLAPVALPSPTPGPSAWAWRPGSPSPGRGSRAASRHSWRPAGASRPQPRLQFWRWEERVRGARKGPAA